MVDAPRSAPTRKADTVARLEATEADAWVQRVQAWREANEIAGRTLMRDSVWIV
jgi:hypothetical protein